MSRDRGPQLAYSESMDRMLDEAGRRTKAAKILAVLRHFLGRTDLSGLTMADIGCSAGFIADELHRAGAAAVIGVDIDVPGLGKANARFGGAVSFLCADGGRLPLSEGTIDVALFNHIYEHAVDPDAVIRELHRVLRPDGVLYLGLGNRLGIIEPHYRLPFLSYLPPGLADRYVRASGRSDHYYERFRTRRGLRRLVAGFSVWDYTLPVIVDRAGFASADAVPRLVAQLPPPVLRWLLPIAPTYVWVATKGAGSPAGGRLAPPPRRVALS